MTTYNKHDHSAGFHQDIGGIIQFHSLDTLCNFFLFFVQFLVRTELTEAQNAAFAELIPGRIRNVVFRGFSRGNLPSE